MLGVQEEDGSFSAHTLSNDHSAQNEDEVARIRGEHPPAERKTVIRQVTPTNLLSVVLSSIYEKLFLPSSSGPVTWPPHAVPCIWGCEVQVEYWTAEACVGVWTWSAPWKRAHQVYPSKLPHAPLPHCWAWDHVPQTAATGSLYGERRVRFITSKYSPYLLLRCKVLHNKEITSLIIRLKYNFNVFSQMSEVYTAKKVIKSTFDSLYSCMNLNLLPYFCHYFSWM